MYLKAGPIVPPFYDFFLSFFSMNNDKANVVFKFIRYPEYIKPGARLLFREGRTKGMGRVTEIEPYDPRANLNR